MRRPVHTSAIVALLLTAACADGSTSATRPSPLRHGDAGAPSACASCPDADPPFELPDASVHDGERCDNGLDDDGDGMVDEECSCVAGAVQRCYRGERTAAGVGVCSFGKQTCETSQQGVEFQLMAWGPCVGEGERADEETCRDGLDNDCDGHVDEDCPCEEGTVQACSTACGPGEVACHGGSFSDCKVSQPPEEQCNGHDDDCDGNVDEHVTRACSTRCGDGTETCEDGRWSACSAPQPAPETCNGTDDDCDGVVDAVRETCSNACGTGARTCTDGEWSSCSAPLPSNETCNQRDDDCDGRVDEGLNATLTFVNRCANSNVFIAFGGCDVCAGTCSGRWLSPGQSFTYSVGISCFYVSASARTGNGDLCLTLEGDRVVGDVHEFCNKDCRPEEISLGGQDMC